MPQDGLSPRFWAGRRVFVTGHTGFMGGWLCAWLARMGAEVRGYALPAPSEPSFFAAFGLARDVASEIGDVRDRDRLAGAVRAFRPEIALHLAAQPLVRAAYRDPVGTYATNVMGTVHLLDALRGCPSLAAAVIVTTDKVYENVETTRGYREGDLLGGREPYGNSKACSELAVDAFRRSYFAGADAPGIATVRAGNIIGGGDWAADRLVPDAVRAFAAGCALEIRHPQAVRPWQHALDPVNGFLRLAELLAEAPAAWSGGWNFGPPESDSRPVGWMADRLVHHWGDGAAWRHLPSPGPYEATLLTLASDKARDALGWATRWDADRAVAEAVRWYRTFYAAGDVRDITARQIAAFTEESRHGRDRSEEEPAGPARAPIARRA